VAQFPRLRASQTGRPGGGEQTRLGTDASVRGSKLRAQDLGLSTQGFRVLGV